MFSLASLRDSSISAPHLQALTEYSVLPLGSQYIHERAPYVKSLLLYGAEKTGKTLLTHVGL
jgi:SpoVK/Ycf46/Vps4 family AAA+-type ATPase